MKAVFWGVRGSIPIPGPDTVRYGGNTSCIAVQGRQNECLIFEAGTGLRPLGLALLERSATLPPINLFISHTHWDHIQGFPFFAPCYVPGTKMYVRGPEFGVEHKSFQDILASQMQHEFFPVSNQQLAADVSYRDISETTLDIGGMHVTTQFMNHSVRSLGFRLEEAGRTLVYTGDHEPYYNVFADAGGVAPDQNDDFLFGGIDDTVAAAVERFIAFIRGADVLIVDSQYTPDEYPAHKRAWGHSSWDYCLEWMQRAEVTKMVLTHHDPLRTDSALDKIREDIAVAAAAQGIDPQSIVLAREGMELDI